MKLVNFMKQTYQPVTCKSALNKINSFLPYHWDLNIYRGCMHQCAYCFAQYSHKYLNDGDFFHHIYIKENIVEELEKKLNSKNWKREVINLGGITDSYQPIEKKVQMMPKILKLLIKYKTPAIISTKSTLILRDIELLKQLNQTAGIQIAFTITTLDENIAKKIEPGASSVQERIKAMRELKQAGLTVGWHLMPIIPYLTGTKTNLIHIFETAQKYNLDYMITSILSLRGNTKKHFFTFLQNTYPTYYKPIWNLYHNQTKYKTYKKQLYELLSQLSKQYNIDRNYQKYVPKKEEKEQLSLF